nr:transposase [Blastococcus mobilis]
MRRRARCRGQRLANERSFAALCGASPMQASSGNTRRYRVNRGGERQANSALWRIILVRMKTHPPTRAYVARRTAEGMGKHDIMRCLKRYAAREIYHHLNSRTPPDRHLRLLPGSSGAARWPALGTRGASSQVRDGLSETIVPQRATSHGRACPGASGTSSWTGLVGARPVRWATDRAGAAGSRGPQRPAPGLRGPG